jgi:acetylornithine deacetylase
MLESLVQEDEDFAASAAVVFARRAYEIPAGHVLVQQLRRAAASAGAGAAVCGLSFWADSAVLGEAGVATVLFGPGGAGLHGVEEYVRIDDVLMCEDALARLARALAV